MDILIRINNQTWLAADSIVAVKVDSVLVAPLRTDSEFKIDVQTIVVVYTRNGEKYTCDLDQGADAQTTAERLVLKINHSMHVKHGRPSNVHVQD